MNQQTTRAQSATEILKTAASTLGERGKQYDPNGKQERSMTAIVAAFNAIYPRNLLTVHMGWQFMSLVKMVRGATKPHADSALDQVAYAALAAECVAEQLHQPTPTKQPAEEPTKYYEAQVAKLRERELLDIETINDLRAELAGSTAAMLNAQEEVTRLKSEATEARKRGSAGYNKQVAIQEELKQRNKELEDKVQSLNNEVEAKVRELMSNMKPEAPCAHNTDEPKAPRPEYVDPFDQYGDRQPKHEHRIVGDRDPSRTTSSGLSTAPSFGMSSGSELAYPAGKPL